MNNTDTSLHCTLLAVNVLLLWFMLIFCQMLYSKQLVWLQIATMYCALQYSTVYLYVHIFFLINRKGCLHICSWNNENSLNCQNIYIGFYGLRGLSIGVMVFILYKLYVLLPYTYPTPKLTPHRRRCISTFPPKNSLCMIYKRFELWGHWKCPHKSPSPCNTYVIPMSLHKFVSS